MPRTVTTLLSSKVLASLPSTTSLLLSHDLHDPLLHVELLLLSLEPLLLSPRTPPLVPQPATISLICQWLPSIWPPTTRQWCFPGCYSIIGASLVHYSPLTLPLQPRTTLYTLRHPTGKRGRPTTLLSLLGWPLPHIQQGKADIYLYGYVYSIAI